MEQDQSRPRRDGQEGQSGGHRRGGQRSGRGHQRPRNNKEWKLIEKLLEKSLDEQAKTRRWGIFFKLLAFAYFAFFLVMMAGQPWGGTPKSSKSHTALVDIKGMIMADQSASADAVASALRRAFEAEKAEGVVLRINSPGGSPVQAGMIYDEIRRLREKHPEKKLYAVITDLGASGGYYIAAAADEIYADKASLIGSIGVISMGFGFTDTMQKLGVERRIFSSGDNKALLDPFLPLNELEVGHFQTVLDHVHRQFIEQVKQGRGERLKSEDIFNGLLWTGEQAVALGLVDGLSSPGGVARDTIGAEDIVNYTVQPNPLHALAGRLGVQFFADLVDGLMTRFSQPHWR